MAQKVHPKVFRLVTLYPWASRWFADRRVYRTYLAQDVAVRGELQRRFRDAGIAAIDIERSANAVTVTMSAARPGMIIGRGGQGAEGIKKELRDRFASGTGKGGPQVQLNIVEVDRAGMNAAVVVQQVIAELEKRIPFRRVIRQAAGRLERAGCLGVRIQVSGRLDGAEIARREVVMHGKIPLQTIRADIDYAQNFARTIYGTIGVKIWVYRGEVFTEKSPATSRKPQA